MQLATRAVIAADSYTGLREASHVVSDALLTVGVDHVRAFLTDAQRHAGAAGRDRPAAIERVVEPGEEREEEEIEERMEPHLPAFPLRRSLPDGEPRLDPRGAILRFFGSVPRPPADIPASTPVGRRGQTLVVPDGTNPPALIGGRRYIGHSLDRMQRDGVTPSMVEETIKNGVQSPGNRPGRTVFDGHQMRVVVESNGDVITVIPAE